MIGRRRFLTLEYLYGLITVQDRFSKCRFVHPLDQRRKLPAPIVLIQTAGAGAEIHTGGARARLLWRVSGMPSMNFAVVICASNEGLAMLLGNNCGGRGAIFTP